MEHPIHNRSATAERAIQVEQLTLNRISTKCFDRKIGKKKKSAASLLLTGEQPGRDLVSLPESHVIVIFAQI